MPFKVESVQELPDSMVSVHMKRRYVHYPVGEYLD